MLFGDGTRRIYSYHTAPPARVWPTRADNLAKAQEGARADWGCGGIVPEISGQTQIHHSAGAEVFAGDLEDGRDDDPCHLALCDVLGRMVRGGICAIDIRSRV